MPPRAVAPLFFALSALAAAGAATAQEEAQPVVVELFTSQGCSSCPPADSLLSELILTQPNLIALTLPVDYWDYIGWKDTLASPAFTARQKAYAATRGDHHVYTPQAVINGLNQVVGSDRDEIAAAAKAAFGKEGALSVTLSATADEQGLSVDLGAAPQDAPREGDVWLLQIAHERTVAIGRGENTGATVTYSNVVRKMTKIGGWAGAPLHLTVARQDLASPDSDGYVLLLQAGAQDRPGPILAATAGGHIR